MIYVLLYLLCIALINFLIGYLLGARKQIEKMPQAKVQAQTHTHINLESLITPCKSAKEIELEKMYHTHRALNARRLH